ncbi:hypothetical protein AOLI_G00092870 [Acnodon oligacanthus]
MAFRPPSRSANQRENAEEPPSKERPEPALCPSKPVSNRPESSLSSPQQSHDDIWSRPGNEENGNKKEKWPRKIDGGLVEKEIRLNLEWRLSNFLSLHSLLHKHLIRSHSQHRPSAYSGEAKRSIVGIPEGGVLN